MSKEFKNPQNVLGTLSKLRHSIKTITAITREKSCDLESEIAWAYRYAESDGIGSARAIGCLARVETVKKELVDLRKQLNEKTAHYSRICEEMGWGEYDAVNFENEDEDED